MSKTQVSSSSSAKSGKPADKGWVLQSYTISNTFGSFSATARVTNTNGEQKTGMFTVTVFKKGSQVATLSGSANEVVSGKTVSVQLISSENFVSGPYTIDFQTDTSF